jgi:hypothetical protein
VCRVVVCLLPQPGRPCWWHLCRPLCTETWLRRQHVSTSSVSVGCNKSQCVWHPRIAQEHLDCRLYQLLQGDAAPKLHVLRLVAQTHLHIPGSILVCSSIWQCYRTVVLPVWQCKLPAVRVGDYCASTHLADRSWCVLDASKQRGVDGCNRTGPGFQGCLQTTTGRILRVVSWYGLIRGLLGPKQQAMQLCVVRLAVLCCAHGRYFARYCAVGSTSLKAVLDSTAST